MDGWFGNPPVDLHGEGRGADRGMAMQLDGQQMVRWLWSSLYRGWGNAGKMALMKNEQRMVGWCDQPFLGPR